MFACIRFIPVFVSTTLVLEIDEPDDRDENLKHGCPSNPKKERAVFRRYIRDPQPCVRFRIRTFDRSRPGSSSQSSDVQKIPVSEGGWMGMGEPTFVFFISRSPFDVVPDDCDWMRPRSRGKSKAPARATAGSSGTSTYPFGTSLRLMAETYVG